MYFEAITAWIALRSAVGRPHSRAGPAVACGRPVERDLAAEPASYDSRAGHERDQRDRRYCQMLLSLPIT